MGSPVVVNDVSVEQRGGATRENGGASDGAVKRLKMRFERRVKCQIPRRDSALIGRPHRPDVVGRDGNGEIAIGVSDADGEQRIGGKGEQLGARHDSDGRIRAVKQGAVEQAGGGGEIDVCSQRRIGGQRELRGMHEVPDVAELGSDDLVASGRRLDAEVAQAVGAPAGYDAEVGGVGVEESDQGVGDAGPIIPDDALDNLGIGMRADSRRSTRDILLRRASPSAPSRSQSLTRSIFKTRSEPQRCRASSCGFVCSSVPVVKICGGCGLRLESLNFKL